LEYREDGNGIIAQKEGCSISHLWARAAFSENAGLKAFVINRLMSFRLARRLRRRFGSKALTGRAGKGDLNDLPELYGIPDDQA
jgi:hypothetical protein